MVLTAEQWQLVQPFLPPPPSTGRRGRPAIDQRLVLDGILFKLTTRTAWRKIPSRFGAWQTCYLHYRLWKKAKVLKKIIQALLQDVVERGKFDYQQAAKDGTVAFERRRARILVYIPAQVAGSWTLTTAMLFYQHVAHIMEQNLSIGSYTDPLGDLFDRR